MGWFAEQPGGLNRFYEELTRHLPAQGVHVKGLVTGSSKVRGESCGSVQAFAETDSPLACRLTAVRGCVRELLSADPSLLVVSHFAMYAFGVLDIVAARPLVIHFQGPWAEEGEAEGESWARIRAKHAVERAVYSRATALIVLSRAFAEVLHHSYSVHYDRIHVVPGAVEADRFAVESDRTATRDMLGWPNDRPIVLSVRRLVRRMGLEDLVVAVATIKRVVPDVLVFIAGKGSIAGELEARVRALGLERNVRLLGFVSEKELPLMYRAADLTIVPTTALEGFGLIVAESLAAGTPALVTPVGALPEVVSELCPDLVLRSAGPDAIAEGLIAALNGHLRMPESTECVRFARERYDWPVVAVRVREVYRGALV
jgi:glycogen(starch) synthase